MSDMDRVVWSWVLNLEKLDSFLEFASGTPFHGRFLEDRGDRQYLHDLLKTDNSVIRQNQVLLEVLDGWFAKIRSHLKFKDEPTLVALRDEPEIVDLCRQEKLPSVDDCIAWVLCLAALRRLTDPEFEDGLVFMIGT